MPPDWYSSALANLVVRAFLKYPITIPTFYEVSRWDGATRAFRVSFDTMGCKLRPILVNPHYTPVDPEIIEQLYGHKLDILNNCKE